MDIDIDERGIAAFDARNSLLGVSCSASLDSGNCKAQPISFDVDAEKPWKGINTIGGSGFPFTWEGDSTPRCGMASNSEFGEVKCSLTYHFESKPVHVQAQAMECFHSGASEIFQGKSLLDRPAASPAEVELELRKGTPRRSADAAIYSGTQIHKDGNPQQAHENQQVTVSSQSAICPWNRSLVLARL